MLLWFGGDDDSPLGLVANLALVLLAPISASLIQLAISRQREYSADATGAQICGNPESLASALLRLEEGAKAMPMQVNQATEPLYIVKPFSGGGIASLFSHPPADRGARPPAAPDAPGAGLALRAHCAARPPAVADMRRRQVERTPARSAPTHRRALPRRFRLSFGSASQAPLHSRSRAGHPSMAARRRHACARRHPVRRYTF